MKRIYYKVLRDLCINCGACIIISPSSFTLNENKEVIEIKKYSDDIKEIEKIYLAKNSCPRNAIIIEEI